MKILREKDLIKTGDIKEIKDLMLYKVMLFCSIVGVPIVLYNVYFAYGIDFTWSGCINLFLFIPIIFVIFIYRRIDYQIRAYVLIFSVILMSLYNFYIAGYTGAAYMLALSAVAFAVAFLNRRQAIVCIFICILVSIVSAYFWINNIWVLGFEMTDSLLNITSWAMSIAVFAFLSFMFLVAYNIIQLKLIQKIEIEHKNNISLEESNIKLTELLLKQEEQQKQLIDAKLKAEESNNLKTEFLHNMSHEVRTPLNGIIGFSRLLKKENITEEKRNQFADIVIQSSDNLQKVIDDILEISFLETRQIAVEVKKFSVFPFLQDLFLIFNVNSKSTTDIRLNCHDREIFIESDQHKLHKILSNLIENALKFTDKGFVEFGCCEAKPGMVCFYVKDTGIGISKENMEKVFARFSQEHDNISVKYGGLGLGLCIAKENAELLGGEIRVESEKGVGTTFFVEIPEKLKL